MTFHNYINLMTFLFSNPHWPQQRLHSRRNQRIQQKEEEEETPQVRVNILYLQISSH